VRTIARMEDGRKNELRVSVTANRYFHCRLRGGRFSSATGANSRSLLGKWASFRLSPQWAVQGCRSRSGSDTSLSGQSAGHFCGSSLIVRSTRITPKLSMWIDKPGRFSYRKTWPTFLA
jgi:hypothetical protein